MRIETTRFGTVDILEDKVIVMPNGLLGFADMRRFCILEHKKNSPFYWFQSLDDPGLAFVITNPLLFKPDYKVDFQHVIHAMDWNGSNEKPPLECYVIVTIPRGAPEKMTANLIGPVVLNLNTKEAVQVVLSDENYSHKYSLLPRNGKKY